MIAASIIVNPKILELQTSKYVLTAGHEVPFASGYKRDIVLEVIEKRFKAGFASISGEPYEMKKIRVDHSYLQPFFEDMPLSPSVFEQAVIISEVASYIDACLDLGLDKDAHYQAELAILAWYNLGGVTEKDLRNLTSIVYENKDRVEIGELAEFIDWADVKPKIAAHYAKHYDAYQNECDSAEFKKFIDNLASLKVKGA